MSMTFSVLAIVFHFPSASFSCSSTRQFADITQENNVPYFRAYTPRVMHFFACHKRLCGLYEGAGYTKHDIMYHVRCRVIEHNNDNRKSILFY